MANQRSFAVLCLGTLVFVVLSSQSVHCQMRWRGDSEEDDSDNSGRPPPTKGPSTPINYWQNSAPALVNLIYTWFHPQMAAPTSKPPVVSVITPAPAKLTPGYFTPPNSGPKKWQSNNQRPNGVGFHPHFGPSHSWKKTSKITRVGPGIYTVERGSLYSDSYLMYYKNETGPISPFHDIPLFANEGNKIFNMVVEVPRWTNAKMEIATKDPLNPIKQDMKKGKLRYVANVFPHHGYIWNYGAIPQTWENPNHVDESTGEKGDNDPIDVCEIGYRVAKPGEVLQVKVLGIIGMLDEGETDWKVLAIDVNDPLAPQLSDIGDVEQHMPGFLKATVEWFKLYKIPDGKPENQFAFNGEAKDREFAHQIILGTHVEWRDLVSGKSDKGELDISAVSVPYASSPISVEQANSIIGASAAYGEPAALDSKVDQWHYVNLK